MLKKDLSSTEEHLTESLGVSPVSPVLNQPQLPVEDIELDETIRSLPESKLLPGSVANTHLPLNSSVDDIGSASSGEKSSHKVEILKLGEVTTEQFEIVLPVEETKDEAKSEHISMIIGTDSQNTDDKDLVIEERPTVQFEINSSTNAETVELDLCHAPNNDDQHTMPKNLENEESNNLPTEDYTQLSSLANEKVNKNGEKVILTEDIPSLNEVAIKTEFQNSIIKENQDFSKEEENLPIEGAVDDLQESFEINSSECTKQLSRPLDISQHEASAVVVENFILPLPEHCTNEENSLSQSNAKFIELLESVGKVKANVIEIDGSLQDQTERTISNENLFEAHKEASQVNPNVESLNERENRNEDAWLLDQREIGKNERENLGIEQTEFQYENMSLSQTLQLEDRGNIENEPTFVPLKEAIKTGFKDAGTKDEDKIETDDMSESKKLPICSESEHLLITDESKTTSDNTSLINERPSKTAFDNFDSQTTKEDGETLQNDEVVVEKEYSKLEPAANFARKDQPLNLQPVEVNVVLVEHFTLPNPETFSKDLAASVQPHALLDTFSRNTNPLPLGTSKIDEEEQKSVHYDDTPKVDPGRIEETSDNDESQTEPDERVDSENQQAARLSVWSRFKSMFSCGKGREEEGGNYYKYESSEAAKTGEAAAAPATKEKEKFIYFKRPGTSSKRTQHNSR